MGRVWIYTLIEAKIFLRVRATPCNEYAFTPWLCDFVEVFGDLEYGKRFSCKASQRDFINGKPKIKY
jgi:hypothetical protein